MQVEFGIDNTLNMSSRKELPDPTRPAVSNRLPVTSRGSGIILEPSHHNPQLLRTNTLPPASGAPTVDMGDDGVLLEQYRHGGLINVGLEGLRTNDFERNYNQFKHRCVG